MSAPDPTAGERVARVLQHMADKMLHGTEVADEDLRSTIDGWAGALHGAAAALVGPATPDADDASEPCLCWTDFTCLAREHEADDASDLA